MEDQVGSKLKKADGGLHMLQISVSKVNGFMQNNKKYPFIFSEPGGNDQ